MTDWRLCGQEEYLSNASLIKAVFPEFWEKAYARKNAFYQKVAREAERTVAATNKRHALLEGENIRRFWHAHCEFCWEKALTDKPSVFYCTEDLYYWICRDCFRDFQEQFHWNVIGDMQDNT